MNATRAWLLATAAALAGVACAPPDGRAREDSAVDALPGDVSPADGWSDESSDAEEPSIWTAVGSRECGELYVSYDGPAVLSAMGLQTDPVAPEYLGAADSGIVTDGDAPAPGWAVRVAEVVSSFGRVVTDERGNVYVAAEQRVLAFSSTGAALWGFSGHVRRLGPALEEGVLLVSQLDNAVVAAALRPDGTVDWALRAERGDLQFSRSCGSALIGAVDAGAGARTYYSWQPEDGAIERCATAAANRAYGDAVGGWIADGMVVFATLDTGVSVVDLRDGTETYVALAGFDGGQMAGAWPIWDRNGPLFRWNHSLIRLPDGVPGIPVEVSGLPAGAIVRKLVAAAGGATYWATTAGVFRVTMSVSDATAAAQRVAGIVGVPRSPPIDFDSGDTLLVAPQSVHMMRSGATVASWSIGFPGSLLADPPVVSDSSGLVLLWESGVLGYWELPPTQRPVSPFAQYGGGPGTPLGAVPATECP